MSAIDERAGAFRHRMVRALVEMGITDEVVLDAMAEVPRHWFVDRFWATSPGNLCTPEHVREFIVDDDAGDEILGLVYAVEKALVTRGPSDGSAATSSVSAPVIVASMLAELDVQPGLRVLEIGTGSGYHAALTAVLVGDPALVTTVDIDRTLIPETMARIERLGFAKMTVLCADGASGVAERAPFDRIVATVGCTDIASAWVEQLSADGQILVPLEHGFLHPRVQARLDRTGEELDLIGRFVGHSGFVRIQGLQGVASLWHATLRDRASGKMETLPAALLSALAPPDPDRPDRTPAVWNLAIYLAMRDRRCATGPALVEHGSAAVLRGGQLLVTGAVGPALKDRFIEIAIDWLELGAPGLDRYTMTFSPRRGSKDSPADLVAGPWQLDRPSHRQTISLLPRSA